jgi:hypothetical protein
MATITTIDGTEIFYKDWGSRAAQPLFFRPPRRHTPSLEKQVCLWLTAPGGVACDTVRRRKSQQAARHPLLIHRRASATEVALEVLPE